MPDMEKPHMTPNLFNSELGIQLLAEMSAVSWNASAVKAIDQFHTAVGTHAGQKRSRNEDRSIFAQISCAYGDVLTVAAVCDGVGGSERGDEAATIAIVKLVEQLGLLNARTPLPALVTRLLRDMDEAIRQALRGSGTTTASILLTSSAGEVVAANVGDSRIFNWRQGFGYVQVSVDDTLENELRDLEMKDVGVLDARGLRGSLSQALGESGRSSQDLRISVLGEKQFPGGGAVLASDGSWRGSKSGFNAIAKNTGSPAELVRRTLALASWSGDLDNASIIAIRNIHELGKLNTPVRLEAPAHNVISAWICDTKVVIHQRLDQSSRQQERVSDAAPEKKGPKRVVRRRAAKEDNERQLKLAPVESAPKRRVRAVVKGLSEDDGPSKE